MRWMAMTVLACMGAACTVDARDQGDGGMCVGVSCAEPGGSTGGGSSEGSSGSIMTTGIDPDGTRPCIDQHTACIEAGIDREVCDGMLAECEMEGSSGSAEVTGDKPGDSDDRCDGMAACCAEQGGSSLLCSDLADACTEIEECEIGDTACRESACTGVIDACRPPEVDPYVEPCASALSECGLYVHDCMRIFGTNVPQEFCESSLPDAEFCAAWIIVCEERRVACDELMASSSECSQPGSPCQAAWRACVEADPALEACWDALETCELDPPSCPEKGDHESCTCADQLRDCLRVDEPESCSSEH